MFTRSIFEGVVIMCRILVILLIGSLITFGNPELLQAQSEAEGTIVDTETGQPLRGVHVFLSGTKIGTVTDPQGRYRLQRIPPGGHRLVVSMIGYGRIRTEITIGPGESRKIDFELRPVIYEMPEIYVGNLDDEWEDNLERFSELFIGESGRADSVEILNPEVLRFDTNWWGRFTAEALAPLEIENRALGYHIRYYLDEFKHTGTRTRWDGEPLFTELTPDDSAQSNYWKENRRDAFYGSIRHFLLALLQDRVKEEGFILHNIKQNARGYSPRNRSRTSAGRLLSEGDESYLHHLNFFGRLEIVYTEGEEDQHYVRWLNNRQKNQKRLGGPQTSYLELNEHPVTLDKDGEILEVYGATQFGYFSFLRIANATPRQYRPDDYSISSSE